MIIQALSVVVEEGEIAAKVKEGLSSVGQLKEVSFALAPGAVKIGGKFQVGFAIPFETQWGVEVRPADGRLAVTLANVSVGFFGLSADAVRSQVMGALAQKLQGADGVCVEGDTIVVDPGLLLAAKGVRLAAPVRRLTVLPGRVELEV
jgi:phosphoserine aminotransferase